MGNLFLSKKSKKRIYQKTHTPRIKKLIYVFQSLYSNHSNRREPGKRFNLPLFMHKFGSIAKYKPYTKKPPSLSTPKNPTDFLYYRIKRSQKTKRIGTKQPL